MQGKRPAPKDLGLGPWARVFAERRLLRVPSAVNDALVAWAQGLRPADVLHDVPAPRQVLAHQARGRRFVSLLPDGVAAAPFADGLAFAIHDLCHLEKFVQPEHYVGQVGFFAVLDRAMAHSGWADLEHGLDAQWTRDRDHVLADMNGSALFLYCGLRKRLAQAQTRAGHEGDGTLAVLLDLLGLTGELREAAGLMSSRASDRSFATRLLGHFEAIGDAALGV